MAFTVVNKRHNCGDLNMVILSCTADAATQTIETGLKNVLGVAWSPISMATASSHSLYFNSNCSGTRSMGVLAVTGVASGDEFCVVCFGY
jgi:hypothetical protein